MRGYLARPAAADNKLPAVLVVHENRGLNPHIEDVIRRLSVAGFPALAPDALTPLGGDPGNDDEGRTLQRKRDPENAGWPAYEQALKDAGVRYSAHIYEGVNHGFHNDTTPRYDDAAAKLAWKRTIDFFNATLR
jgi:dienelactone hydrolase